MKLTKIRPGTGDIRLRIKARSDQKLNLFYKIMTKGGGYVTVDWGDGIVETFGDSTVYSPSHVYDEAGEYIVKLTGSKFEVVEGDDLTLGRTYFQSAVQEILSLKMPTDSTNVSLHAAFRGCTHLTGRVPEWDDCIVDASSTYHGCAGLTGRIPEWGPNIVDANDTYHGCVGLTGNIPEWGAKINSARFTYSRCRGLTGNIPEWGPKIKDATFTYSDCTGLTGEIPEWGMNITKADDTYLFCTGLTGCSKELLQDPMPSRIKEYDNCVAGCAVAIRQHFTEEWGGTKTKLTESRKKFRDVYRDVYKQILEQKRSSY